MEYITTYVLPCLWAFCACVGFAMAFNIRTGILICGAGAALGWFAYLVSLHTLGSDLLAAFVAAMVISLFSEIMARIRRCPVTGYLQVALLPLVPGAGIYDSMRYCVAGEMDLFLAKLVHTIGTLMVLVPGMALTNAMREIMAGDIISGVTRTAEVLLIGTAIALGVALPLMVSRLW